MGFERCLGRIDVEILKCHSVHQMVDESAASGRVGLDITIAY